MSVALLLIDVQGEYFAPHGKWALPDGEKALGEIQTLLAAARAAYLPVFHVVHESLDPSALVFRRGTPGVEIHPEISLLPDERIIRKHFPGSFTQTPLEAYLRQTGVDTVVISGFMTHVCCDTTTRQARERGFSVWFAADATATRDLPLAGKVISHRAVQETNLAVLGHFASVLPVDEIVKRIADRG